MTNSDNIKTIVGVQKKYKNIQHVQLKSKHREKRPGILI